VKLIIILILIGNFNNLSKMYYVKSPRVLQSNYRALLSPYYTGCPRKLYNISSISFRSPCTYKKCLFSWRLIGQNFLITLYFMLLKFTKGKVLAIRMKLVILGSSFSSHSFYLTNEDGGVF